jgi:hypothetical protein
VAAPRGTGLCLAQRLRARAIQRGLQRPGHALPLPWRTEDSRADLYADQSSQVNVKNDGGLITPVSESRIIGNNITASSIIGTASATAFTFTGQGTDTLPANYLDVGETIHIVAAGTVTTDGSESETLTLTFKIGSKTIYTSLANSYSTASTAVPWTFDCTLTQLTAGASGTAVASGTMATDPGAAGSSIVNDFCTSITSFDTTATQQITVTATWANGDASPDVATMNQLFIESCDNA